MCLYENNHKLFFNDMLVKKLCSIQNVFQLSMINLLMKELLALIIQSIYIFIKRKYVIEVH